MHIALAAEGEDAAFAPEPFSTLYQRSRYQAMRGSVGRLLRELRHRLDRLPSQAQELARDVIDSNTAFETVFARLVRQRLDGVKIRGHGDLHLGQTLNTGKDFYLIDFEGDATRPVGERVLKRSPLVDVAAMMRSFDYAASVALQREGESDRELLRPWTEKWVAVVGDHFLQAYLAKVSGTGLIPSDPVEIGILLSAFLLERAISEVKHDLEHRPEYLPVSLRALLRLLAADQQRTGG
jgi:maltose alpha-D-glucosyltransferase/alpha-amylase